MKRFILFLAALAAINATSSDVEAQRNCTRGKPCGNTCIARNLTCRVATPARPTPPPSRAAPAPAPAVRPPEGARFVASTRGRVYYPISCPAWNSLSTANLRWFATAAEAQQAGLRPTLDQRCAAGLRESAGPAVTSDSTDANRASAGAQGARPPDAEFVASSRGRVYYPVACDAWRSLSTANLRWFSSREEAEAAGYTLTTNQQCAGVNRAPAGGVVPPATPPGQLGVCTVVRIVDGDTVDCAETDENVRLLLIDTPEMGQGEFGVLARDALAELLPIGTAAKLELDVQERDRYGRILAYLYGPDGRMVNGEMVRRGLAFVSVYPPNVRYVDQLRAVSDEAEREGRGLWGVSAFSCMPADYRAGVCR